MRLPTWSEIEEAPLDVLQQLYWQPVPAFDADSRARVRRMAERMAELAPRIQREYLPATVHPKHPESACPPPPQSPAPEVTPPCKPKPKPKPQKPAEAPADLELFKRLLNRR